MTSLSACRALRDRFQLWRVSAQGLKRVSVRALGRPRSSDSHLHPLRSGGKLEIAAEVRELLNFGGQDRRLGRVVLAEEWRIEYNTVRPHSSLRSLAPDELRGMELREIVEPRRRSHQDDPIFLRPTQNVRGLFGRPAKGVLLAIGAVIIYGGFFAPTRRDMREHKNTERKPLEVHVLVTADSSYRPYKWGSTSPHD